MPTFTFQNISTNSDLRFKTKHQAILEFSLVTVILYHKYIFMSPYMFYLESSGNRFFLPTFIYKTYCPTMFGAEKETSFTYCVSWLNSNNQVLMICKFFSLSKETRCCAALYVFLIVTMGSDVPLQCLYYIRI